MHAYQEWSPQSPKGQYRIGKILGNKDQLQNLIYWTGACEASEWVMSLGLVCFPHSEILKNYLLHLSSIFSYPLQPYAIS